MEGRKRQHDDEVYTIKQVVEMTGVPDNTIRSWERRFNIPNPGRSGSNQRRYTRADVEAIRSIQAARERGRTMDQAIAGLRAASPSSTLLPNVEPLDAAGSGNQSNALPGRLAEALTLLDGAGADSLVRDLAWSSSTEEVCFDLLLPAYDIVESQHADGTAAAHGYRFAADWIVRKLLSAFDQSQPEFGRTAVVVAAMHDDSPRILSLCHATVLSRAGYAVSWHGAGISPVDVRLIVDGMNPSALVFVTRALHSETAARAAANALVGEREAGRWTGVVAIAGTCADFPPGVVHLSRNIRQGLGDLDRALHGHTSNIRLMRNT